jgi:hypothetical protein
MAAVKARLAAAAGLVLAMVACNGGDDDVDEAPSLATATEEARSLVTEVAGLFGATVDERMVGQEQCRDEPLVYASVVSYLELGRPAEVADLDTIGAQLVADGFEEMQRDESRGGTYAYWERASTQEAFDAFVADDSDRLDVTAISRCAQPDA